ncbi:MAG: hypothetical protein QM642_08600, partial [Edaphocola sp.]
MAIALSFLMSRALARQSERHKGIEPVADTVCSRVYLSPPDAITGPDRACPNIPIRYEAGNPEAGTTFGWSVTGGGTVSAAVGGYSYVTFGSLPATVKVARVTTDGLGCASDTLSYDVDVAVPPLAIGGPDSVCH